eukprot:GHRR01033651.1.p2 GENE.GHRR01033651.1~~GHRR01033651.1.p2  ORF type:complete len:107 (+),score=25.97 GHRR01033651.1:705-1025(+)
MLSIWHTCMHLHCTSKQSELHTATWASAGWLLGLLLQEVSKASPTAITMTAAVTSSKMMAQHIHLRVFFCKDLASCRATVPLCTYSTLRATCSPGAGQQIQNSAPY